jgi:hypothetical protein
MILMPLYHVNTLLGLILILISADFEITPLLCQQHKHYFLLELRNLERISSHF